MHQYNVCYPFFDDLVLLRVNLMSVTQLKKTRIESGCGQVDLKIRIRP